jgi:membrane protein implicated in regulation of membrane protease activity
MAWADFYLFCFAFGFFFSLVTVVTGHLHFGFGDHDLGNFADVGDTSHAMGGDAPAADGGHHGVSPFNFATLAAFLAMFGGTGYLVTRFYRMWFVSTLMMAVFAGVAGGSLIYLFLSKVLMRSREDLDPADYEMCGVLGKVTGTIRSGGIGEILFSQEGTRRAAPARSENGDAIPNGTEVVVTRFENGVAYVRRWDELTSEADTQSC